jgi:hypothetical protein
MSRQPPEVDALGNFNPHYQEGLKLPIATWTSTARPIDIHTKTWTFKHRHLQQGSGRGSGQRHRLAADPHQG